MTVLVHGRRSDKSVLVLFVVLVAAGCGEPRPGAPDAGGPKVDGGLAEAPLFRNVLTTPDAELGPQALGVLGVNAIGEARECAVCHGLTRQKLRYWQSLSEQAYATCFSDLAIETAAAARAAVDCLRGGDPGAPFLAEHAGIFATAARLEWLPFAFERAYGADWEREYEAFLGRAAMPPKGHTPMTQGEFDVVAEYFLRGAPGLETLLPTDPVPTECTPSITAAVGAHIDALATTSWKVRNRDAGTLMYGCAGASTPAGCLSGAPLAASTERGAGWDVLPSTALRILSETTYRSAYWTRSSPDGRFVGHGRYPYGARLIDLVDGRVIQVNANYDPAFFPDNSGFAFLDPGGVCEMSVLLAGAPTSIGFDEPGCGSLRSLGPYEHFGASLEGGDHWAVHGQFITDDGGTSVTPDDPAADYDATATTFLTRMENTGAGFVERERTAMRTPYEGDAVLSPSSKLLISRVASEGTQLGYVLRRIDIAFVDDRYTVTTPEIARYCDSGSKPSFSFDERSMVLHHYFGEGDDDAAVELGMTGADDPAYAEYAAKGASNIYLVDLRSGTRTRITNMAPGQYALFPHFRSDGWVYFIVRVPGVAAETVVASDAALGP